MELIPITKDIMINPELIESVELKRLTKNTILKIRVTGNSKPYQSDIDIQVLLKQFKKAGVNLHEQFFAG